MFYSYSEVSVCPVCIDPCAPGDACSLTVTLTFSADVFWQEGKASGAVYSGEPKLTELLVQVLMCMGAISGSFKYLISFP